MNAKFPEKFSIDAFKQQIADTDQTTIKVALVRPPCEGEGDDAVFSAKRSDHRVPDPLS